MSILEDITSMDPTRILSASWDIINLRDKKQLKILSENVEEIKAKTDGIELGGSHAPNQRALNQAIAKLRQLMISDVCFCDFYQQGENFNPRSEAERGHVEIKEEKRNKSGWIEFIECFCSECGTRYKVYEKDYHFSYWEWRKVGSAIKA